MKKKRKLKKKSIFVFIMILLCIFASFISVYSLSLLSGVETMIRMVMMGIIIVLALILIIGLFSSLKKKNKKYLIYIPIVLLYSGLLIGFSYYIKKTYNVVANVSSDSTTYSSSIVTLSSNKADDIKDVKGKIGYLKDKNNIIGNTIPTEVIKDEKLSVKSKKYDSYIDLINALYNETREDRLEPAPQASGKDGYPA